MAMALTMDEQGQRVAYSVVPSGAPPGKRKWRGQGVRHNKRRYRENIHKVVKQQSHGLGLGGSGKESCCLKRRKVCETVPGAPHNDNSFLMRVRRSGGLESSSLVFLRTNSFVSSPKDSSYKLDTYEDFVDHEDYGYGSMTGLIRLRRGDDGDQSSGSSTVENENNSRDENVCVEHPSVPFADSVEQVEQRLDRGVGRFEMIRHPSPGEFAELRVARHDGHIQMLEDENLVLKERLFLVQQEVNELRQRLQGEPECIDVERSDESDD